MKRPTVGIVTHSVELAMAVTAALPMDVETHTHLSWEDHGIDVFACDVALIGADLARECPVRALTSTCYVIAPDRGSLPVGVHTDADTIGASGVLTLDVVTDRAFLWSAAHLATNPTGAPQ